MYQGKKSDSFSIVHISLVENFFHEQFGIKDSFIESSQIASNNNFVLRNGINIRYGVDRCQELGSSYVCLQRIGRLSDEARGLDQGTRQICPPNRKPNSQQANIPKNPFIKIFFLRKMKLPMVARSGKTVIEGQGCIHMLKT